MQKIKDYVKAHPGVTGVIGTGLVAAAGYYGGPPAASLAAEWLPSLCTTLGWC